MLRIKGIKLSLTMPWRQIGVSEVQLHPYLMHWIGGKCQIHASTTLNPALRKKSGTHWTGGWVGSRAEVDIFGKRKNFLPLPGLDPVHSLITIPTTQPRLSSDSHCGNGNINNRLEKRTYQKIICWAICCKTTGYTVFTQIYDNFFFKLPSKNTESLYIAWSSTHSV